MNTPLKTTPFDAAKYLDTDEAIAAFLMDAFESGHDGVFQDALKTAARARGMSEVAKIAGLGRESLYKALQSDAQPRFATVRKVMAALGVQLAVVPMKESAARRQVRPNESHPQGVDIARALSSRERARRTGRYVAADVVLTELQAKLDKAKKKSR
ncbi:addiction module antidote protein [Arenimonas daejeonensis]|uniref:addiction module antidote protein n=1 Tax=Arenimonas daejeonensis TaxID=370777 RepID=UPI0011BF95D3|nr:addiction module antidote protein [Arenimonas daejeonensis]